MAIAVPTKDVRPAGEQPAHCYGRAHEGISLDTSASASTFALHKRPAPAAPILASACPPQASGIQRCRRPVLDRSDAEFSAAEAQHEPVGLLQELRLGLDPPRSHAIEAAQSGKLDSAWRRSSAT